MSTAYKFLRAGAGRLSRLVARTAGFSGVIEVFRRIPPTRRDLLMPVAAYMMASLFEVVSAYSLYPLMTTLLQNEMPASGERLAHVHASMTAALGKILPHLDAFKLNAYIAVIAFLASFATRYLSAVVGAYSIQRYSERLRNMIFHRFSNFGMAFYEHGTLGEKTAAFFQVFHINRLLECSHHLIYHSLFIIGYLAIMLHLMGIKSLLLLGFIGVLLLSLRSLLRRVKTDSEHANNLYVQLVSLFSESITAIVLIKATGTGRLLREKMQRLSRRYANASIGVSAQSELAGPLQESVTMLVVFAGLLITDSKFILETNFAPKLIVVVFMVRRVLAQATMAGQRLSRMASSVGSCGQILLALNDVGKHYVSAGSRQLDRLETGISIHNLSFSHGAKPVLKGVSLRFPKNKKIALVGESGAGKSSLVKLLMRFYDCPSGAIFIDGTDIRDFALESLMQRFAYLSQDVILLNASIRENLLFGGPAGLTDAELTEALVKVNLLSLIRQLPDGLDSIVGESGIRLSGGEKQRIGLARAFLKKADILILDEPTSALDAETEKAIEKPLNEISRNQTVITVTHRLATVRDYDYFYVLRSGRIAEEGTLTDLLNKQEYFYRLWNSQTLRNAG